MKVKVIKKGGKVLEFDGKYIEDAIQKSAFRAGAPLSKEEKQKVVELVEDEISKRGLTEIRTTEEDNDLRPSLHTLVEDALDQVSPVAAKSYRNYRNYKGDFAEMMKNVYDEADRIIYRGDKENSNKDSSLVSTQGALIKSAVEAEMYKRTFLTEEELKAVQAGFIYPHDMDSRLLTTNCCLFDIEKVLTGGFEMGNIFYNEPKTLDVAFDVVGDIVLSAASQQYGGFTLPEIDKVLAKYAKKSYDIYFNEAVEEEIETLKENGIVPSHKRVKEKAHNKAMAKVKREMEQGWQGWEMKFNTVGSSRGDYPFITVTLGLDNDEFAEMCAKTAFEVHSKGQGKPGKKRPVLFPKYVFLYDEKVHGSGTDIYEAALDCSRKTMYPDHLSLSGKGYVPDVYRGELNGAKFKKGTVVSPMGCRAFLSPWFENGKKTVDENGNTVVNHFLPSEDGNDKFVAVGRFNSGAISLNLPLIYLKSQAEGKDFFETLDYYLEMIRSLHKRTKEFLGNKPASINPLAFCEGGFYGGNLKPHQKLKESPVIMDSTTWSYGITALNELQEAYNKTSITTDGEFALKTLQYINDKANEYKGEDHMLYAMYGTPAESLCGKQIKQLREYVKDHHEELEAAGYEVAKNDNDEYVIPGVCDREYVTNSFHSPVWEQISPVVKQDKEYRFWNLCNGGKIQYVRYKLGYNTEAMRTLLTRAMDMGFYEGVNLALNYCDDCGYEQIDMDKTCPCCGSENITKIDRMNGYLSFSRVKGESRLNDAKMAEIADRESM